MKSSFSLLGAAVLSVYGVAVSTSASSQSAPTPVTVTADENGNGSIVIGTLVRPMLSGMTFDLSPGGLPSALTYLLDAPSLVPGEVILSEGPDSDSDVIRFVLPLRVSAALDDGPTNFMIFYSDNGDGSDALADTGLPTEFRGDPVIAESGPEGNNGAFYTPTPDQPGYVSGYAVTYHFISDSSVPEPATWAMMLLGFGAIAFGLRRKSRAFAGAR